MTSENDVIDAEVVESNEIEEELAEREVVEARQKAVMLAPAKAHQVDALVQMDPEKAIQVFEAREKVLTNLRRCAIRATRPIDWTLARDGDRREVATLRKSGAVILRKYYGISVFDVRPVIDGVAQVQVTDTEDGPLAEVWGSGRSNVTGEEVYDVRGQRGRGEGFTGRGTISDLKEAARTGMETKIVRILTGTTAMPVSELEEAWDGTAKSSGDCYHGPGYGSRGSRRSEGGSSTGRSAGSGGRSASGSSGARRRSSTTTGAAKGGGEPPKITESQRKKLYAVSRECIADSIEPPMKNAELKEVMTELLEGMGYTSSTEIPKDRFDDVLEAVKEWKPKT